MKLYVDDIRACPEGWIPARTVTEAIRALATMPIDEVSLDHDIVSDCDHRPSRPLAMETFEPVARYIAMMSKPPSVRIHTANPPAGERMAEILGIEYRWPEEI